MANRNVMDVIKEIILIIPAGEIELQNQLKIYSKKLWNKAPEQLISSDCWTPFIQLLNDYIPEIKEDWQINISTILKNVTN
jgi:hypothetical protein